MKKGLSLVVALTCLAVIPAPASAQVARTWVDQAGSDSNDCSFDTPCLTFAKATQPLIEDGEINAKSDGNFGEFSIGQGLTLDGRGHSVGITAFGAGISINAPGDKVTIRNLHIQGFPGAGDGISVESVAQLRLRDVTIRTMDTHGIDFRAGPVPARLTVINSSITDNLGQGIAVSAPAAGSGAKRVVVRNSEISSNGSSGIWTGPPPSANPVVVGVFDSTLADNGAAAILSDGAQTRARIAENVITGNLGFGLRTLNGGQIRSYGNNRIYENAVDGAPTSVIGQN